MLTVSSIGLPMPDEPPDDSESEEEWLARMLVEYADDLEYLREH